MTALRPARDQVTQYLTMDNGGRYMTVLVAPANAQGKYGVTVVDNIRSVVILAMPMATDVLLGNGLDASPAMNGNHVLVSVDPGFPVITAGQTVTFMEPTWILIGTSILSFRAMDADWKTIPDPFADFLSPVGNSAVPYAWAVGHGYYWFLEPTDNRIRRVAASVITDPCDPYGDYYSR